MIDAIQKALYLVLHDHFKWQGAKNSLKIEVPPPNHQGDFAVCLAPIASALGKKPHELVQLVVARLATHTLFESVCASGAFINMTVNRRVLFGNAYNSAFESIVEQNRSAQTIGVEYLSPNTNKPLHLGHIRNGVLGVSLANLYKAIGHPVVTLELINDRGAHIMKSMLAYTVHGHGVTPKDAGIKPDHFVGDWYVRYMKDLQEYRKKNNVPEGSTTQLEEEVSRMLQAWEAGDEKIISLWRTMNDWVYAGFEVTCRRYGFTFDDVLYESDTYTQGKLIALRGVNSGIFVKDESGAIVYRLPQGEFDVDQHGHQKKVVLIRSDGTSLYLTQDLETAVQKFEKHYLYRSIYVVADEQNSHFKELFHILNALGYPWASQCKHFSYAMVNLPSGRMKSREGNVVDADDLADEMARLAFEVLHEKNRGQVGEVELRRRADIIGLAAIKFYFLKFSPQTPITFNTDRALSFEGDTGPYCLYAYARISSLIKKATHAHLTVPIRIESHQFAYLNDVEERALARELTMFPQVIRDAAVRENPMLLVTALLKIARSFNRFYKDHLILDGSNRMLCRERLALVIATKKALGRGLAILGIEVLDEM